MNKIVILLSALALTAVAQNPGIQRTIVQRQDLSIPGREAVVARVELAPGTFAGRHTHTGEEISYVMDGEMDVLIEGRAPQHVKAGESFIIPAGAIHDAHNTGSSTLRLVGVYLVEKGKPLATPAK
ncbi:MAG TPA: cupin domain-containing protein [Bryobacteraceae bacterium]|nr:cupin domain-containing protein [Bryobacteraceae bacterium]